MSEQNKKRCNNFNTEEIEYLLALVADFKQIIECKQTDRTSSEEKNKAWMEIEKIYNSQFGSSFRSAVTLKTKYNNLKKNAKKNFAEDKRHTYVTGGGPKVKSAVTATDNSIMELCDSEQMIGFEALYDDDVVLNEEVLSIIGEENAASIHEHETVDKENNATSWAKYTPNMLRTPRQGVLKPQKQRGTQDIWADVGRKKEDKMNVEIKILKRESRKRIKFLEKENELKLKKLNLEIQLLQKQLNAYSS